MTQQPYGLPPCPACGAPRAAANGRSCVHCGAPLPVLEPPPPPPRKKHTTLWIILGILFFLLVCAIIVVVTNALAIIENGGVLF